VQIHMKRSTRAGRYVPAQQKFEEARVEELAEAHNNLAFGLRMQGVLNRERALRHYNRALELKRVSLSPTCTAGAVHPDGRPRSRAGGSCPAAKLDPQLAVRLERIMAGDGRDDYDGLTPQYGWPTLSNVLELYGH
jgi:hypothetical protein